MVAGALCPRVPAPYRRLVHALGAPVLILVLAGGCALDLTGYGAGGDGDVPGRDAAGGEGDAGAAEDASRPPRDGGGSDAGRPGDDGGPLDGGPRDSGPGDAGPRDAGPPDTGPTCIAVPESCNAMDDDCDGEVDEGTCGGCERRTRGTHVYLFCDMSEDFAGARSFCMARGYDLVIIDDDGENSFVTAEGSSAFGGDFWIGITDSAENAVFRWVDGRVAWRMGTSVLYTHWRSGEPDGRAGYDCAELDPADGTWNDVQCGGGRPWVCEVAAP